MRFYSELYHHSPTASESPSPPQKVDLSASIPNKHISFNDFTFVISDFVSLILAFNLKSNAGNTLDRDLRWLVEWRLRRARMSGGDERLWGSSGSLWIQVEDAETNWSEINQPQGTRNARHQQEDARPGRLEGTLVQKKRKEDARPGAHGGRSSRKLRGRSPARIGRSSREDVQRDTQWTLVQPGRSGRSSSQAEDARSARQKRTLVQRDKRTLVQDLGRSSRPEKRTLVHIQFIQMIRAGRNGAPGATFCERLAPGRETERAPGATFRESLVLWRCDFTAGAHGGREELVGTSPPLPLGLLLLPSSMFQRRLGTSRLPLDLRHHAVTFVFLLLCRLFLKAKSAQRAQRVEVESRRDETNMVKVYTGQLFGLDIKEGILVFAHSEENEVVGVEHGKERGCDVDGGERVGFGGEGLRGEE
ncbi:hypothetical protein LR48_Vigan01g070600 [Vigna angularis]|uniref:Uncharacterized protein n=1 Tax=Phaseolus angularis TaxID=3914 RepID=A0A0L9TKZ6_PHAAN|nr:hypothetical protein LR48_Vigan01g070600 [Vigna angularis]